LQPLLRLQEATRRQVNKWKNWQEVAKTIKRTEVLMLFIRNKKGNSVTTAKNNTRGTNVQPTVHYVKNAAKLIIGNLSDDPANGNNSTKEESRPSKSYSQD
jgi:hypothetical protein